MFHRRQINYKINKIHERALKIVHKDHFSSFEELLSIDKSATVNQRNPTLAVRKLSMSTLYNLPSTDRVHYIMSFNMTNAVCLRVRGSLSGNFNTTEI